MVAELAREKPEASEAYPADLERQKEIFEVESDEEDDDSDEPISSRD